MIEYEYDDVMNKDAPRLVGDAQVVLLSYPMEQINGML